MTDGKLAYQRRTVRLQSYDYTQSGFYFIIICTYKKKWMLGEILNDEMHLNNAGQIIESVWLTLPERFPSVGLDHYVTMPNHFHGIIVCKNQQVSTTNASNSSNVVDQRVMHSPLPHPMGRDKSGPYDASRYHSEGPDLALGEIIRTFKAASTHRIRTSGNPNFAWQSNYYEHIVRNDNSLDRIRQYIIDNPVHWSEDSLHTTQEVT